MAINGQAIKEVVYILHPSGDTPGQLQAPIVDNCDLELPALAEYEPSDPHFNDRHSEIWFYNDLFTNAKIYLQKKIGGTWTNHVQITDNTLGTFYAFGFFVNKFNDKAIGFLAEWTKILNAYGTGSYRFKATADIAIGSSPDRLSFEFNVQVYTAGRADHTTRIEWNRSGVLGNISQDDKVDDYGTLNWYNQLRIPNSTFGFDTGEATREFVRYPNGQEQWLSDEQEEELIWNVYALPYYIHKFLRADFMQAGKMTMTDYNSLVPTKNVDRIVKPSSAYKPDWQMRTQNANVTVTFNPYFKNLTHKRE